MATAAIMKTCSQCSSEKPLDDFHRNNLGTHGRHPWCKQCKNAQNRERYAANYNEERHRAKARTRKHRYGIDSDTYLEMVKNSTCAICGTSDPGRGQEFLCIDHDHNTGEIRGLLCIQCNLAIGYLRDDPTLAMRAASYLQKDGDYHRSHS